MLHGAMKPEKLHVCIADGALAELIQWHYEGRYCVNKILGNEAYEMYFLCRFQMV